MKKRYIIAAAAMLVLTCWLVFTLYPISFDDSFDSIAIGYMEPGLDNDGKPFIRQAEFQFSPQDAAFAQMQKILGSYAYHNSITTLFSGAGIRRDGPGYTITIALQYGDGTQGVSITNAPYIMVGPKAYRMGYWGNAKALALGGEIKAVLALD